MRAIVVNRPCAGFTLIELVIIIVILGIIAAVAIPRFGSLSENSRINATKEEMLKLKRAIVGDPRVVAGGKYINRGFEGDVGHVPTQLIDLAAKPDSISAYNKFTRIGWNGPYIDSLGQEYLSDAWGNNYIYDPAGRTITSTGTSPNIVISF
jgi:prepilin-type N-terminal cleavage/methylation domain-containing protein